MKNLLMLFIAVSLLTSCSNYYRIALGTTQVTAQKIEELKTAGKYFILRDGGSSFTMNNITLSTDQKTLQCTLDSMPRYEHRLHIVKGENGNMKYQDKKLSDEDESGVLTEVHVYSYSNGQSKVGTYSFQLDQVQKMEIIEKDKARTKTSHAVGASLGITGAVVVVGAIIMAFAAASLSFGL